MTTLYAIDDQGRSERLTAVGCKCEDRELQQILEHNLDLLPGEQITPESPRRWLLIRREMPVPDPSTGSDRWSVDFLLADQDATPTFVECKRFADTRSRREIVGQMFEYAANGHYYWSKEELRAYAERAANQRGASLDDALSSIEPADSETVDAFFQKFQDNLREGQLRIVFFLEESPSELRSIVDFLNRQLERSEILIVEARQFERNGQRFVVPSLFGYSEEARRTKRIVTVSPPGAARSKRVWDEESLFSDLRSNSNESVVQAARRLLDSWTQLGCEIEFLGGPTLGRCEIRLPQISQTGWMNIGNNGNFSIALGGASVRGNTAAEQFRDRLIAEMRGIGFDVPEPNLKSSHKQYRPEDWVDKVDALIDVSKRLFSAVDATS